MRLTLTASRDQDLPSRGHLHPTVVFLLLLYQGPDLMLLGQYVCARLVWLTRQRTS